MPSITDRLRELGIVLPPSAKPVGSYTPVVTEGHIAWVSGQIAMEAGAVLHPGLVDRDVLPPVAKDLARHATVQALAALAETLGSLDRVRRVLRVVVYVASSPGFTRQHEVANGATDLLVELFGAAVRPARVSVGVAGLPLNGPVEVEIIAEFD